MPYGHCQHHRIEHFPILPPWLALVNIEKLLEGLFYFAAITKFGQQELIVSSEQLHAQVKRKFRLGQKETAEKFLLDSPCIHRTLHCSAYRCPPVGTRFPPQLAPER